MPISHEPQEQYTPLYTPQFLHTQMRHWYNDQNRNMTVGILNGHRNVYLPNTQLFAIISPITLQFSRNLIPSIGSHILEEALTVI
jgi:hypothetical protein